MGEKLSRTRVILILLSGVFEAFTFGYIMDGWPSLVYILDGDGVYSYLCTQGNDVTNVTRTYAPVGHILQVSSPYAPSAGPNRPTIPSDVTVGLDEGHYTGSASPAGDDARFPRCQAQQVALNAVYIVGLIVGQFCCAIFGLILDKYGLRISRLISLILMASGCLMLTFQEIGESWLCFPGTAFISAGQFLVLLNTSQVALLAGRRQSAMMGIYAAMFNMTALVSGLMQIAYDSGISRQSILYFYTGLMVLHLLNTVFLSPKFKVNEGGDCLDVSDMATSQGDSGETQAEVVRPFRYYALTQLYIFHVVWYVANQICFSFIIGSMNAWFNLITDGDSSQVSQLTMDYQYMHFLLFAVSPLVGMLVDYRSIDNGKGESIVISENKALVEENYDFQDVIQKAKAMVPTLAMTSCVASLSMVAALFWSHTAALAVSALGVTLKAFLCTSTVTFCQRVFPLEFSGLSLGVCLAIGGCMNGLEVPIFAWAQNTTPPFTAAHILILILSVISVVHPVIIWVRSRSTR